MKVEIPGVDGMREATNAALLDVWARPDGSAALVAGTCRVTLTADDLRYLRSELERQGLDAQPDQRSRREA